MKKIIKISSPENYTPRTQKEWFDIIVDFDGWIMENYKKYHEKNQVVNKFKLLEKKYNV